MKFGSRAFPIICDTVTGIAPVMELLGEATERWVWKFVATFHKSILFALFFYIYTNYQLNYLCYKIVNCSCAIDTPIKTYQTDLSINFT